MYQKEESIVVTITALGDTIIVEGSENDPQKLFEILVGATLALKQMLTGEGEQASMFH